MSCVASLVHQGIIYMAADSAATDTQFDSEVRQEPKIFFVKNRFLIGSVGSYRLNNLLRFSLQPPPQKRGRSDYPYLCADFIPALLRCFRKNEFGRKAEEDWAFEVEGEMLVGYKNNLYQIGADLNVGINQKSFCAIGSGGAYALGVLFALEKKNLPPEKKLELALKAAAEFSAAVRPPFIGLYLGKNKKGEIKL